MVCRECGAYNAEHLTHCRVCSAKLRDDDPAAVADSAPVEQVQEESESHPARGFVSAPSWPKSAYAGAPEAKPIAPARTAAPAADSAPAFTPQSKSAAPVLSSALSQASEPALRRACPHCGKATLADAPYCAYCGELLNAPAGTAAKSKTSIAAAAPAIAKKPVRQAPVDDFDEDEDDDFDDEDDEDFDKPVKKHRAAKKQRYPSFDDEDDDEDFDDDDEDIDDDDDAYDDDDEFDDDDDGAVYKKRGKGTTILFWGLIALLVIVIVIFGKVIADRNFDGDFGEMFASIGSMLTGKTQEADTDTDVSTDADAVASPNMYTATISPSTDESGAQYYDIDIYAPTGSTLKINSNAALDMDTATVPSNDHVILHVVADAFLPNTPCDSETITVTPDIQAITPEGETIQISVPAITLTVPVLAIELTEPSTATVQATFHNDPVVIAGRVDDPTTDDDHTVEVYINGQAVEVYAGGQFSYTYTPTISPTTADTTSTSTSSADTTTDPAEATTPPTSSGDIGETVGGTTTDDTTESPEEAASDDTSADATTTTGTGETITIEARKNNCVTARTVITIEPYVIQNMSLIVTNDAATGMSSSDGNITLQGTVTPGASIAVSCASDKVSFGEPSVSATGNFSIAVTISEVGPYTITLTATQEGYTETSTSAIVERPPTETYKKFLSASSDLAKIIDKVTSGETTSGQVYATGTVTEIVGTSPYTIFKMKLSDGSEIVVCNRSAKSTINSSDVKDKKQVIGNLLGTYLDTGLPYVWAWFILNK